MQQPNNSGKRILHVSRFSSLCHVFVCMFLSFQKVSLSSKNSAQPYKTSGPPWEAGAAPLHVVNVQVTYLEKHFRNLGKVSGRSPELFGEQNLYFSQWVSNVRVHNFCFKQSLIKAGKLFFVQKTQEAWRGQPRHCSRLRAQHIDLSFLVCTAWFPERTLNSFHCFQLVIKAWENKARSNI